MAQDALTIPTVHLGGTSGKELLAELRGVIEAAQALGSALRAVTVNGRDFYVQREAGGYDVSLSRVNEARRDALRIEEQAMEAYMLIQDQIPEGR